MKRSASAGSSGGGGRKRSTTTKYVGETRSGKPVTKTYTKRIGVKGPMGTRRRSS